MRPTFFQSANQNTPQPRGTWPEDRSGADRPHSLSDATFGSEVARHFGEDSINDNLPEATAQCCRNHGVSPTFAVQTLTVRGHGPTLRGLMLAPKDFSFDAGVVALFLGGCGTPAAAAVVPIASGYLTQQAAICVIDYRGFGCSSGAPSQGGLYDDGARMLDHLHQALGVPNKHIVLHGYAHGASVAAELAARCHEAHGTHLGGLVLDRPMASVLNPVICDQSTGLGYLGGLLGEDGDEDGVSAQDDHITHKLERVDPATPTVVLKGVKDSLGVDGAHLYNHLRRLGFAVSQAHLCSDATLSCYELFSCSEGCLRKLCENIEP